MAIWIFRIKHGLVSEWNVSFDFRKEYMYSSECGLEWRYMYMYNDEMVHSSVHCKYTGIPPSLLIQAGTHEPF